MKRITHVARTPARAAVAVLMALAAGACTGSNNTASTTAPTPVVLSNEFTGTLTLNGAASYPFNVLTSGTVTGTIASLSPDLTQVVGFGIGVWDGLSCQAAPGVWNDRASQNTIVVGQVNAAGSLCVRIYDSQGTMPQPEAYDITVTHP